jgi:hypothetical protein
MRPEIWAMGLRNPWRFWIDATSGSLYVGDAGNARREEIDLASTQRPGLNFGWPCFEGTLPFDTTRTCDGATPPLLDYPRAGADCAVIGGVVERDPRLAALAGRYLYGDFCAGTITAIAVESGKVTTSGGLGVTVLPELAGGHPGIELRAVRGARPTRRVWGVTRVKDARPPAADEMLGILRQVCAAYRETHQMRPAA